MHTRLASALKRLAKNQPKHGHKDATDTHTAGGASGDEPAASTGLAQPYSLHHLPPVRVQQSPPPPQEPRSSEDSTDGGLKSSDILCCLNDEGSKKGLAPSDAERLAGPTDTRAGAPSAPHESFVPGSSMVGKQGSMAVSSMPTTTQMQLQTPDSCTLAMSANCPGALRRQCWSVQDFDLRSVMYHGSMSIVYHAVDKRSGITVALKLYKRHKLSAIERHQVSREIKLHAGLAHPSIIAMYAAWKDRNYVYMALEWAPGGDVYSYFNSNGGRLSEETTVKMILEPFLSGLQAIHAQGLIHRDVKPENILLTRSFQIKICDFGLAIDATNEAANTRLGTIDYLAPEILDCPVKQNPQDNKENPNIGYTNKVDCWSAGVLAYELLVGEPPFVSPTAQQTLRLIRSKELEFPSFLSREAVSFLRCSLVRDPSKRFTIKQLLEQPLIRRHCMPQITLNDTKLTRRNSMPLSFSAARKNIKDTQQTIRNKKAGNAEGAGSPRPEQASPGSNTSNVVSAAQQLKGAHSALGLNRAPPTSSPVASHAPMLLEKVPSVCSPATPPGCTSIITGDPSSGPWISGKPVKSLSADATQSPAATQALITPSTAAKKVKPFQQP